jgi:hypothetical protein
MTQLLLVVPGLIWPASRTHRPAQDLPLPALARLLGFGRRRMAAGVAYEQQLAQIFKPGDDAQPLAALRLRGEDGSALAEGDWLCADPVHLSFAQEHLLLSDFNDAEIDAAQAATLVSALNADFADIGAFSAATPTRWYLKLARPPSVRFSSLHEVVGRPVQDFLPAGADASEAEARRWRHALSEIQIALHNHPVNKAREVAGQRTINSLWFWGGGAGAAARVPSPAAVFRLPPTVQAAEPVARGMARAAGMAVGVPDPKTAFAADTLVVLDALAGPARHLDLEDWRAQLLRLENDWFAPVMQALDSGRLHRFELLAPGDATSLALSYGRGARWGFWRRPLALDELHASFSPSPPAPLPQGERGE